MNKALLNLGVFFFIQRMVNLTDPSTIQVLRVAYVTIAVGMYLAWQRVVSEIEARKATPEMTRPIWVKAKGAPNIMSTLFGATEAEATAAPEYTRTTLYELEAKIAKEKAAATTTAPLMQLGFSFYMNVQLPLALQCVMTPINAADEFLLVKYVLGPLLGLGTPASAPEYLTEDPATATAAGGAVTSAAGGDGAPAAAAASSSSSADVDSEEAVLSTWEASTAAEPVDVGGVFEALRDAGKDVNYATSEGGWTGLMVTAGSTAHGARDVTKLIDLGADPARADKDGWTALHWAAHHGVPASVGAVVAAYGNAHAAAAAASAAGAKRPHPDGSKKAATAAAAAAPHRRVGDDDDLVALLRMRDAQGRTAADVARAAGNTATAELLDAAAAKAGASASPEVVPAVAGETDGLRHRAGHGDAAAAAAPADAE
jgi:hypothetical protein